MLRFAVLLLVAALLSGCAVGGHACRKDSDTEYGGGFYGSISKAYDPYTILLIGNFSRLSFDGGHDNLLGAGLQVRRRLGSKDDGGPWLGLEAKYNRETSVFDEDMFDGDPSANGFTLGALVGYHVPAVFTGVNLFVGMGLLHLQDFKVDGNIAFEDGGHTFTHLGVEVPLPF
jgi:hypothetical protein